MSLLLAQACIHVTQGTQLNNQATQARNKQLKQLNQTTMQLNKTSKHLMKIQSIISSLITISFQFTISLSNPSMFNFIKPWSSTFDTNDKIFSKCLCVCVYVCLCIYLYNGTPFIWHLHTYSLTNIIISPWSKFKR